MVPVCRKVSLMLLLSFGFLQAGGPEKGLPGDAEAATHGDEAATLQVVKETREDRADFLFRQYNLGVLSHYSYLIASGGEAIVVDPARDVARYLKDAEALNLKIRYIYLTHSHADFVAGHLELARAAKAEIVFNEASGALFPHRKVKEGDEIRVGQVRGVVVTTPGHTPDGTCLYVYTPASASKPERVLTGDTLFIGSVGRPDLMGEGMSAATLAEMGYYSWKNKLSKLPDETKIFPAHGAGSLCGAHLSSDPVSTIGVQRKTNVYLQHKDLTAYVMAVINGLPDAPQYFKHNAKMNHDGPPLVDWDKALPKALAPAQANAAWLLDVRDSRAFAKAHPKGAINVGIRGRFETWTGTMIPWGEPFILVGSAEEAKEAYFRLRRIGYDEPVGYLEGGVEAWHKAGLPLGTVELVSPLEVNKRMKEGTAPVIVDVRLPSEWMGVRIGEVLNLPINTLFSEGKRLDRNRPVLTVCNSAYRSSMGASVLLKMGFQQVQNMDGGGEAWISAGLPTLGPKTQASHAAPAAVHLNLPDRIAPESLARQINDLPGTEEILDIRPAKQFAEYNIPTSRNVEVQDLLNNPAYLTDPRPLVIVCRDGSISAAVGGALVNKTKRQIRVMMGGVSRYYDEMARPRGIRSEAMILNAPASKKEEKAVSPSKGSRSKKEQAGTKPAASPQAVPVPVPPPAPAPAQSPQPKKKSAGC